LDIEKLKKRLQKELPGRNAQYKMLSRVKAMPDIIPENAKPSAVLVLLFPKEEEWHILYIQRAIDGHAHSGQIGFPGGRQEPDDANLSSTALREACEEVGIKKDEVQIIGQLTSLYIPVSNFIVYPFIAVAEKQPDYLLQEAEVHRVLEIPVKELLNAEKKTVVEVTSPADKSFVRKVPAYKLEDDAILWGATAMITAELETILEEIF